MIRTNASKGRSPGRDAGKSASRHHQSSSVVDTPLVTLHTANLARLARSDRDMKSLIENLCGQLHRLAGQHAAKPKTLRARAAAGSPDGQHGDSCWLHHIELRDCGTPPGDLCVWQWWECSEGGGYWIKTPVE